MVVGCVTVRCVQDGESCLYAACEGGHLKVVEYLCELGGEKLLMQTNEVSEHGVCMYAQLCTSVCSLYSVVSSAPYVLHRLHDNLKML